MRERSPRSMLTWISRTYDMPPGALALMFRRDRRTVEAWMRGGRVSVKNGARIRSSYTYLANLRDPLDIRGAAADL